jgi:hypothetical protein
MISKQSYIGKNVKQKHLDLAREKILQPTERLLAVFYGQVMKVSTDNSRGRYTGLIFIHDYLLLTDKRLVLWARSLLSESMEEIYYGDIVNVESSKDFLIGTITLRTAAISQKISGIPKKDLSTAMQMIRKEISKCRKNECGSNLSNLNKGC